MRRILPFLAIVLSACGNASKDSCPAGEKRCGSDCVSLEAPQYGCQAETCTPCPSAGHAAAICVQGSCSMACTEGWSDCDRQPANGCEVDLLTTVTDCGACGKACEAEHTEYACTAGGCAVKSCEGGWQDCNASAVDGCEADPQSDPSHCGACGHACPQGERCLEGQCAANPEALAWLETQKGGWCLDDYQKLVNLCGKVSVCHYTLCGDLDTEPAGSPGCYDDYQHEHEKAVPFCCDPRFMKQYPDGIAVDVGFHYDGVSTGQVLDLGGDVEGKRVTVGINEPGKLDAAAGWPATFITTPLPKGTYLVSYYVSQTRSALYVNGVLAGEAPGAPSTVELAVEFGPGLILGSRVSYWWEATSSRMRLVPFLFQLRDGAPQGAWSLQRATSAGPDTLLLFTDQGVSGNAWTAQVGPQTAYAITIDPLDPEPVWVSDAGQCL